MTTNTTVRGTYDDWTIAGLVEPLVADFAQTTDPEQRHEAAFQLGAMKTRFDHMVSRPNPNPSRGEEVIEGITRAVLQFIDGLIEVADEQLRSLIEGMSWGIHHQI